MIFNQLKIAFRNLWKNKAFTLINLVGLSLGITCGLGIFIIAQHQFSFDRFHPAHKRIFRIVSEFRYSGGIEYQAGVPLALTESFRLDFPQVQKVAGIFGGYNNQIDILNGLNHPVEKRFKIETGVFYTMPEFFDMFRFKWLAGDPIAVLSKPNQAAITRDLAEKYFGSWQNALGKLIQKDNDEQLQVMGILENPPVNTDFPLQVVISYTTLLRSMNGKKLLNDWGTVSSRSQCFIQLADKGQATELLNGLTAFRNKHLGRENTTDYYSLQALNDIHFNERYGNFSLYTISKKTLWSLLLMGAFLLALACINFINLTTAHATKRSREIGIRKVLGSKRWQLGLQFMGETLLLVLAAGIVSALLLTALEPFANKIIHQPISLNPLQSLSTIFIAIGILAGVTLVAGFYPALILSSYKPIQALKNKITVKSASGISLRRVLVAVQFMVAQALIFSTLIIADQLKFFQNAPLGFNKNNVVNLGLPHDSISRATWPVFGERLSKLAGVEHVSMSYSPPSSANSHTTSFRFNQTIKDEPFETMLNAVDTAFFAAYQLKFLAGRIMLPADTAREAIINETLLKKLGMQHAEQALGKYIVLDKTPLPVVGVVSDFHQGSLRNAIEPVVMVTEKAYYRMVSIKFNSADPQQLLKTINKLYGEAFPAVLPEYNFLDDTIAKFYKSEQSLSRLSALFAGAGIFISCIGLYGLILFMTVQRIKEVGIRKVLGASAFSIVMLFCQEFVWLILIAFIVAVSCAAYLMSSWLNDFAYHITLAWWMFASVGAAALFLALATVSVQTVKSALANPVKSLRSE